MSPIQGCKQHWPNSCEWKCIKRLDERDGTAKKRGGGEAGRRRRRRGRGLMEANSTGFVKDDLITSSRLPRSVLLFFFSLSFLSLCIRLFLALFFAAFDSAANLIKLTITLCGKHTHTGRGGGGSFLSWAITPSKGGFIKTNWQILSICQTQPLSQTPQVSVLRRRSPPDTAV